MRKQDAGAVAGSNYEAGYFNRLNKKIRNNNIIFIVFLGGLIMWKLKNWRSNKGFTITEISITIFVISILSGMGLVGFSKITGTNQQTQCINNLREISQGLQLYHSDFRTFPEDGYPVDTNDLPLYTELAKYVSTRSTFVCPADQDVASSSNYESYDPYYVQRAGSYQNEELLIGCPRHSNDSKSASMFSMGSTELTSISTVELLNGQAIPQDGTQAERTITMGANDTMTFADLSTIEVTAATGGNHGATLVQSVRLADGTLYSIVRVEDDGTIDVNVTPGSKFEIVTPSAIVGVRGTAFDVVTSNGGNTTNVNLSAGTVILMNRITGETTTLTIGGTTAGSIVVNEHRHWHFHGNGTYHNHDHGNLNQYHHGNPAVAMKEAGGTIITPGDEVLIDTINDTTLAEWEIVEALKQNYPLSDAVLLAMINRDPIMTNSSNNDVLKDYKTITIPLSENVLNAMINEEQLFDSFGFKDNLVRNSPLPQSILDQIIAGIPTTMTSGDRQTVINAQ